MGPRTRNKNGRPGGTRGGEPPLAREVSKGELIGLPIRVEAHPDPTLVGVEGRVADETQKTLLVESGTRVRRVAKAGGSFRVATPKGAVTLAGDRILVRPEDRTKKVR